MNFSKDYMMVKKLSKFHLHFPYIVALPWPKCPKVRSYLDLFSQFLPKFKKIKVWKINLNFSSQIFNLCVFQIVKKPISVQCPKLLDYNCAYGQTNLIISILNPLFIPLVKFPFFVPRPFPGKIECHLLFSRDWHWLPGNRSELIFSIAW